MFGRGPGEGREGKFSIHRKSSIDFMTDIGAPPKVIEILKNGFKLPFTKEPENYFEDNNASAKENMTFLRGKIAEWEHDGHVKKVDKRPRVCSPLSVATKIDLQSNKVKLRPCLDASRYLNTIMEVEKVSLTDLSKSEKQLMRNDYMNTMDLENCYFHVSIVKEHQQYLGFQVPDEETGDPIYYVFTVLIYGLSPAAWLITFLTKPIISALNQLGIRTAIFIDDARSLGSSDIEARRNHETVLKYFQQSGWNIQWTKTSEDPSTEIYHQGFIVDSKKMIYTLPEFKIKNIKDLIGGMKETINLRDFAKVVGKLSSAERAIGPVSRVMTRSSYLLIAEAVEKHDQKAWEMKFELNRKVLKDLNFVKDFIQCYNGQPIITSETGFCLNTLIEPSLVRPQLEDEKLVEMWASDTSEIISVAYDVNNPLEVQVDKLTVDERTMSSSGRELLAVEKAIQARQDFLKEMEWKLIYWLTDSQVLCIWLNTGSRISSVASRIVKLFRTLHKLKIRIVPIWLPRSEALIQLADKVSKFKDTDDWGLSTKSFKILQEIENCKFTLDAFASCTNKKVAKFYSKVACPGSAGVNAFLFDWSQDYVYANPPVNLIIDVLKHIQENKCRGVLIVPNWKANVFWPMITCDGKHLLNYFTSFRLIKPTFNVGEYCENSIFRKKKVEILAISWNTIIVPSHEVISKKRCLVNGCDDCSVV